MMDKKDIEQKVREILANKLEIPQGKITPESKLTDDLGMDSFSAVELNFEIEEKCGIEIPEQEMLKIKTVGDIVRYLKNEIKDNG